jgi:hypothetical protein
MYINLGHMHVIILLYKHDHIPIRIQFDLTTHPPAARKRLALEKLNTAGLLTAIQCSRWTTAVEPLKALQEDIRTAIKKHCPVMG